MVLSWRGGFVEEVCLGFVTLQLLIAREGRWERIDGRSVEEL
jgi:hypothetical protein